MLCENEMARPPRRSALLALVGLASAKYAVCSIAIYRGAGSARHRGADAAREAVISNHRRWCDVHGYEHVLWTSAELPRSPLWANSTAERRRRHPAWLKLALVEQLLLEGYEAVMTLDLDAVVTNPSVTIEAIVERAAAAARDARGAGDAPPADAGVILSGDTNLVNTAQVLYRSAPRTLALLRELWKMPEGAPNWENGALAAWLGGCAPGATREEMKKCYEAADPGWDDPAAARSIRLGAWRGLPALAPQRARGEDDGRIAWLPQRALNSYACRAGAGLNHSARPLHDQAASIANHSACAVSDRTDHGGADVALWRPGDFVLHFAGQKGGNVRKLLEFFAEPANLASLESGGRSVLSARGI